MFFFFAFQKQRKPNRVSQPFLLIYKVLSWVFVYNSDLPCIVTCPPQSPVRCCRPWSFSAWLLSWESQQLFGFCTKSITLALLSSRHLSTTLRSESRTPTGPAWWRLRRLTVCPSKISSTIGNNGLLPHRVNYTFKRGIHAVLSYQSDNMYSEYGKKTDARFYR